ncbi:helix-turn-helix transcriptional regulator [Ancylobacter sp. VKM B-3255]|uniref:Helix-turn-helix transcriptional regulator n=2 Tax=Ancylobacter radicis TaxID=2836179 RepID=A0ABS5RAB4_9HYPH|nr:helix-turn-helix transcriptional regulator [Ancylobacter radicis]
MQSSNGEPETGQGYFGERICQHLMVNGSLIAGVDQPLQLPFAVTYINCPKNERPRTEPIAAEDAFSVLHQLKDIERHARWVGGVLRFSGAFAAGTASVVHLHETPQCEFTGPLEALQFHLPRAVLDDFFREHKGGTVDTLRWPRDRPDETMAALSRVLLAVSRQPATANRLFVDQLGLSLLAHIAESYGGLDVQRTRLHAGLAPWQQRRTMEMMQARISGQITIEEIARECQITPSHFARAFRVSFGSTPHRYLSDLRIAEAKRLMRNTDWTLADIALMCGFTEQSHFTRVFRRLVGASPGSWRQQLALKDY